ncbi:MAG TPA: hypothetical protein VF815_36870 [Myxococcaceae bacterium]|jgi:hypothetical protein
MSQLLYGFCEVLRNGRWHLVPEANVQKVDGGKTLESLLVDLFHHGPDVDESTLQLDTSSSMLSDKWVEESHLAEVRRDFPEVRSQDTQGPAFQLDYATLKRFEWSRRLKWIHPLRPEELARGRFDSATRTRQPVKLEDFLVKDAGGVEQVAAGDSRVADDVRRELVAREFPILTRLPTANSTRWAYESGSGRRANGANEYLIYSSYQELLRGSGFLEDLLPAMECAVATADGQRPEHVRLVFWFE